MSERAAFVPNGLYGVQETASARVFKIRNRPVTPFLPTENTVGIEHQSTHTIFSLDRAMIPLVVQLENNREEVASARDSAGKELIIPIGIIREQVSSHTQFQTDNSALLATINQRIQRLSEQIEQHPSGEKTVELKERRDQFSLFTLNPKEHLALYLNAFGLPNKEVSRLMGLAPDSVHKHLGGVLKKLGKRTSRSAWMTAVKHGFIDSELLPSFPDYGAIDNLTSRQRDVFNVIVANPDISRKQLASALFVNEATARNHLTDMYKRLGAGSSIDSVLHFYLGWKKQEELLRGGQSAFTKTEENLFLMIYKGRLSGDIIKDFGIDPAIMSAAVEDLRMRSWQEIERPNTAERKVGSQSHKDKL